MSNNNIEEARKSLDAKLADLGYEHPDENIQSTNNIYKVYTENGTDVYKSQKHDTYATFDTFDTHKPEEVQNTNICPQCQDKATYACPCAIGEMMCNKGHMWYVAKNGEVVFGDPHSNLVETASDQRR